MGKFEHIVAQIALLPRSRQDEIADLLAVAFAADIDASPALNPAQVTEIELLLTENAPLADEADVEAFFADALKS
jgi:hypothetical protein